MSETQLTADRVRPYPTLDHIRVGIVGYGGAFNMGRRHGQSMELTGKMSVAAVCDLDPVRVATAKEDFPSARIFTDLATMLARVELDLVTVILPHHLHAPVAMQCAEAGQHVVVEKPMCLSNAEAEQMIAAAQANHTMLSVFHNRRWDGDFMALREILCEKKLIGEVFHVEMFGGSHSRPRDWWRSTKAISGGLFFDWGAHYLDWLLQLVEAPVTGVTGFFHKLKWHECTNEDNVEAAIRFANGCVAHVQWSALAMVSKERWRVLGTDGAVVSGEKSFKVTTELQGYRAQLEVPYRESAWDAYYANIAAHLSDGAELLVKPEQSQRVIAIMEAAELSSQTGVTQPLGC